MIDYPYLLTPALAWLLAGTLKFIINSVKSKRLALDRVGYGGFPSNHSAIVSSTATIIFFLEGINSAAFGVAITLAFIVMLDANVLRRQIGKHAEAINAVYFQKQDNLSSKKLRERMGHTLAEIVGGIIVGISAAALVFRFSGH